MNTRTALGAAGLSVVTAVLIAGCGQGRSGNSSTTAPAHQVAATAAPSSAKPTTDTHAATQTIAMKTGDGSGVGSVTVTKPKLYRPRAEDAGSIHGQLYRVRVTIRAARGSFEVVPGYFTAQNSSGDTFRADIVEYGNDLEDGTVEAGRRTRGYLAFDVPKGQKITTVTLVDGYDKPAGVWDF